MKEDKFIVVWHKDAGLIVSKLVAEHFGLHDQQRITDDIEANCLMRRQAEYMKSRMERRLAELREQKKSKDQSSEDFPGWISS
jgi:hypothetical protein